MRALVIDDSRTARRILSGFLADLGFDISEAGNGREALAVLAQGVRHDLALVDWNMPEMDGHAFVCALRADPTYKDVRVMMVTTKTEMEDVASALQAGADEYIMKPFTREALMDKLNLLGIPCA